jgi:hypothetical protein
MKKIIVGLVLFSLWIGAMLMFGPSSTPVMADPGQSVSNRSFTLFSSQAVATGATVTSTPVVWDHVMNNLGCDVVVSNGTATGQITFDGSMGSATAGAYVFSTGSITTITSKAAGTVQYYGFTSKPFRVLRAQYYLNSASSVTAAITINCGGVQ